MDILPNEVETIKNIGELFGDSVKLVKTYGGFHLFIGKKNKNATKAEVLMGSSHEGIGIHKLEKEYGSDFKPLLAKSEHGSKPTIESKTNYLSSNDIKKGLELFVVDNNDNVDFVLYKHGLVLGEYLTKTENKNLVIKSYKFKKGLFEPNKEIANGIARAMKDTVYSKGLKGVIK